MLKLLCVTAHPDDEAGGFGGTLLHYANRGVETHVLCLTAGTAAKNRGGATSDAELAQMRRRELAASCRVLKVTNCEVLDYPDAKLPEIDFRTVVGDVVLRIRRIRPQVVMTFGPEGGVTAHLDHGMVGVWTSAACQWAGRKDRFPDQLNDGLQPHRVQKLYYVTAMFTIEGRPAIAMPPVTASIDVAQYLEAKGTAFQQHTTQAPLFKVFEERVSRQWKEEFFHLAAANSPRRIAMEDDLFAGVVD
jgi:LmbE family N-acetylglucosaminyl deacetylase